jgi:hypothetical protein
MHLPDASDRTMLLPTTHGGKHDAPHPGQQENNDNSNVSTVCSQLASGPVI